VGAEWRYRPRSDSEIESYLKSLLRERPEGWIGTAQEGMLAELFDCVRPPQITLCYQQLASACGMDYVGGRAAAGEGGVLSAICSLVHSALKGALSGHIEKKVDEDARAALCTLARRGFFSSVSFSF